MPTRITMTRKEASKQDHRAGKRTTESTTMKNLTALFSVIIFSISNLFTQQIADIPMQTIDKFVDGYNAQNYSQMSGLMSAPLKLVFTTKRVEVIYGTQFEMLGKARISKITKRSEQSYWLNLKYERDTTEVQKLGLTISGKGKIIGLVSPGFNLLFPKTDGTQALPESIAWAKVDSIASLKFNVANFNGCVLIMKDKKPFYQKCFGYSDLELKTALNESSLFDLASISKQFTAMAIMILKKQGKLNYDQRIQDFIPDFPYKGISIHNLLTHTSGLPDYMELFEEKWDKSKIAENKDVLDYLKKYKPKTAFKPGTEYDYSNTGYVILALIIEKASGKPYSQFLSENIFQTLEMNDSGVHTPYRAESEIIKNYAKGYTYDSQSKKYVAVNSLVDLDYYRYLGGVTGDGAVNSTISDLEKWSNALGTYKLIDQSEFYPAIQPVQLGKEISEYGYGWELQTNDKYQKVIYHSGNWAGNINFILHFLEKELTVVVLSNNEYFNVGSFAYKIAEIMNK